MIEIKIAKYPDDIPDWEFVIQFLRLRREVFVEELGWNLPVQEGLEFEQYDSMATVVYVMAVEDGAVVGGGRLLRTDHRQPGGHYTYMIKDAHEGRLDGMPSPLCFEAPPVDPGTWELTRITAPTRGIARAVCDGVNAFLRQQGARYCLGLGQPGLMKLMGLFGYRPVPIGEVQGNADGRFLAFRCEVSRD